MLVTHMYVRDCDTKDNHQMYVHDCIDRQEETTLH